MINTCKNCSNQFTGKFCNNCGEKIFLEKDKSLKHFFGEAFHFVSHLDNKYFKTLLLVFRKPGKVSLDYSNGIRSRYYKPVSFFLIGVILYLIFPFFQGLNISLQTYIVNLNAQKMSFVATLAAKKAAAKHISINQLAEIYDHMSPKFAKVLLLIILPLSGIVLKLMFRKKYRYYFDHMVLATEASSFYLYFTFFVMPILLYIPVLLTKMFNAESIKWFSDIITMPLYMAAMLIWLTSAFRTFYKIKILPAFFKGIVFLVLHFIIIYIIYRLILFLVVLLFI